MSALVGHHARRPGSQLLRFRNSVQPHSDRYMVVTGREADLETRSQCIIIISQVAMWSDETVYVELNNSHGWCED